MVESILETLSLKGRTALVTGAAGFIGAEVCAGLAELGADVLLVDRDLERLNAVASELTVEYGVTATVFACDLESEQARGALIIAVRSYLKEEGSFLSILINNAAFVGDSNLKGWTEPFESQSLETWRRAMEVNLTASFHLCQQFAKDLKAGAEAGVEMGACTNASIVNIGSIYGHCAPDWSLYEGTAMGNPAAYAVSKAGLHGLTTWLSTTLAPEIRVNTVSPSGVFRGQPEEFVDRYIKTRPLGRMISEHDVAHAVVLYASDLFASSTGQSVMV